MLVERVAVLAGELALRLPRDVLLDQVADPIDERRGEELEQHRRVAFIPRGQLVQPRQHGEPHVVDDVLGVVERPQRLAQPVLGGGAQEGREPLDEPAEAELVAVAGAAQVE
jgi:hypothetical protein